MRQDNHPDVVEYHRVYAIALAADEAYSAAITAAGYKDRWTMPKDATHKHPEIAVAFASKVAADIVALEWFRISFKVCHG